VHLTPTRYLFVMPLTDGWTRDRIVQNAYLHHLLHSLASARYDDYRHRWEGDRARGLYVYENGEGDALALRWGPEGVLALVHDHESDRAHDESVEAKRLEWLASLADAHPTDFAATLAAAERYGHFVAPTAGLWAGASPEWPEPAERALENGLWLLERYSLEPKEALSGRKGQNWRTLASVPRALSDAALALASEDSPALGPKALTALAIFTSPKRQFQKKLEAALRLLGAAGVQVPAVDWGALGPKRLELTMPEVLRRPKGTALELPELEPLGVRLIPIEPTRLPRTDWKRALAVQVSAERVQGWDPGDASAPGPELVLLDAAGKLLPAERTAVIDWAAAGVRRVFLFVAPEPLPQDARLRISFRLDDSRD
jgi:hypothetical protein